MSGVSLSDLMGVGIALAAGLLIGLERGWHQRDRPTDTALPACARLR
jgi:uncharacterized membrane protein YhiD involved in acid resistance